MDGEPVSKSLAGILTTVGTAAGIVVGCLGMWFTLSDRIEKQVEARVTAHLTTEGRIVRMEEKVFVLQAEMKEIKAAR